MIHFNSYSRTCHISNSFRLSFPTQICITVYVKVSRKNVWVVRYVWISIIIVADIYNRFLNLLLKMTVRYWISDELSNIGRTVGNRYFICQTYLTYVIYSKPLIAIYVRRWVHKRTWLTYICNKMGQVLDSVMAGSNHQVEQNIIRSSHCLPAYYWPLLTTNPHWLLSGPLFRTVDATNIIPSLFLQLARLVVLFLSSFPLSVHCFHC
jgi:hypothetical protein